MQFCITLLIDGLTIIIPALNEEATLGASVEFAGRAAAAAGLNYEILVVDDGSTDRTAAVAENLAREDSRVRLVRHERNQGMGGAFKTGVREATRSHCMVFPADNEHPVEGVVPILQARGKADLIIPFVVNPSVRARHRQIISKAYTLVVNTLFGLRVPYYNGLVLHRTDRLRSVEIKTDSFSYQTEAILRQVKDGATWYALGVPLGPPSHNKTKAFRLKNVTGVIATLVRLRLTPLRKSKL